MSRVGDLATVLGVVSKVLTKNAALRSLAKENKWKTSSIYRDVGTERPSTSTYDTFYTDAEPEPASEPFSSASDVSTGHPTENAARNSSEMNQSFSSSPRTRMTDNSMHSSSHGESSQETTNTAADEIEDPDQDIFVLRLARSIPKLKSRSDIDPRKTRKFRSDNDSLRPTQSDRFDIRTRLSHDTPDSATPSGTRVSTDAPTKSEAADAGHVNQASENLEPPVSKEASTDSGYAEAKFEPELDIPGNARLSSSAVPSSRFSRLYHYTTLGASLGYNVFADSTKRLLNGPDGTSQGFLSSKNTDLLVRKLSRMRGAALKLGQMISFQDENLPGPIREVLQRVQDSADYMPLYQLEKVMTAEFGANWRDLFAEFNEVPMAAASIGQVHKARLPDGRQVAVKVQYPGVANSISSDLRNLSLLLTASRLLPKGLYLDKTIENARTELGWECDYVREAENTKRFKQLVGRDSVFKVPDVIDECSGSQVLTTEFLHGVGIAKSQTYSQELRDYLGSELMKLCLRELAEFKFMQTDPNWTNFLFNEKTKQIELLDFGACRAFDESFISKYCELLVAASRADKPELKRLSTELGYLTGAESTAMVDAHLSSILTLSEPFSVSQDSDLYDFRNQTVTERVKSFIPVMLRERLAPPPEETYSLHRRLSGHFLLCARMGSRIPCRQIFSDVMTKAGYMTGKSTI